MNSEQLEHNFNSLVSAFRTMEGSARVRAAMLSTAMKDIRWGAWDKLGVTEEALHQVAANRENGKHDFFMCETAHEVPRRDTTLKLVTEEMENPYKFMRESSHCVVATREENREQEGHGHFSRIHPLDPSLFTTGIMPKLRKRHAERPEFEALVEQVRGQS